MPTQSPSPVQRTSVVPSTCVPLLLLRLCRVAETAAQNSGGRHALLLTRCTSLLKPPQIRQLLYRMRGIYSTSVGTIMVPCSRYSQAFLHSRHASLFLPPSCGPFDIPPCRICARCGRPDKTKTAPRSKAETCPESCGAIAVQTITTFSVLWPSNKNHGVHAVADSIPISKTHLVADHNPSHNFPPDD